VFQSAGEDAEADMVLAIAPLVQERIKTLNDAVELTSFFFLADSELEHDAKRLIGKKMDADTSLAALRHARTALAELPAFDEESIEAGLRALATDLGLKAGPLFGIVREAVSARKVSPPLFGTLAVLGRERVLARMDLAERVLGGKIA